MKESNKNEEKKKEQVMTITELREYIRTMPEGIMIEISFGEEEAHV